MSENVKNANKRIARNTIWLYLRLIIATLISLYSVRIVMNELGVEGFGLYNVVAGFVTTIGFIGTAMTSSIQRFYNFEIGKNGERSIISIYSNALKIQFWCSAIIIILFETIGLWYLYNVMVIPPDKFTAACWIYQFAVFSIIFGVMVVPYSAFVISKEHMGTYSIISTIDAVGKLAIALSLCLFDSMKLEMYGFLMMLLNLFNFACYFVFCKIKYPWLKYSNSNKNAHIKNILTFTGWNTLGSFTNMGRVQGVNLTLNYFFGVAVNAANAITTQIYSTIQLLSLNICMAFRPQMVEEYARGNMDRVKSLFYHMTKLEYTMVYAICVPLALNIDFVLNVWLGDNNPQYTNEFTIITLLMVLSGSLHTPIAQIFYANGNVKWLNIIYSSLCLGIPIAWIAYYFECNVDAIFWILVIFTIFIYVSSLLLMKTVFTFSICEYCKSVAYPLVCFTVITPIVPLLFYFYADWDSEWLRFLISCALSLISSILGFIYFILPKNYRTELYNTIKTMINK